METLVSLSVSLIQSGANIERKNNSGFKPLHAAIANNKVETLSLLIKYGALVQQETPLDKSLLHFASQKGFKDIVEILIDINRTDMNGCTPLNEAVYYSQIEIVQTMLANKADTEIPDINGFTPLHIAALTDFLILKILIDSGSNVNSKNSIGITPLHCAIVRKKADSCEALILNGADIDAKIYNIGSPMHLAIRVTSVEILKLLLLSTMLTSLSEIIKDILLLSLLSTNSFDNLQTVLSPSMCKASALFEYHTDRTKF